MPWNWENELAAELADALGLGGAVPGIGNGNGHDKRRAAQTL